MESAVDAADVANVTKTLEDKAVSSLEAFLQLTKNELKTLFGEKISKDALELLEDALVKSFNHREKSLLKSCVH